MPMYNAYVDQRLRKMADESEYTPKPLDWGDLFHPERRLARKGATGETYALETGEKAPYDFRKPVRGELRVDALSSLLGLTGGGILGAAAGGLVDDDMGVPIGATLGAAVGAPTANLIGRSLQHRFNTKRNPRLLEEIKRARSLRTDEESEAVEQSSKERLGELKDKHLDNWSILDYLGGIPSTAGRIEASSRLSGRQPEEHEDDLGSLVDALTPSDGTMSPAVVTLIREKLRDRIS